MSTQTGPTDAGRPHDTSRAQVRSALGKWRNDLIDVSGRNRLLYFKDLRRGTLNLGPDSDADAETISALLRRRKVQLSKCFPADGGEEAIWRAQLIHRKALEHQQERGIHTLRLGWYFATWERLGPGSGEPRAPVLLAPATLTQQGRLESDFELSLSDDWELNRSLVQLLKREFDAEIDDAVLGEFLQAHPFDGTQVVDYLRGAYGDVPGFDIRDGFVLATFAYTKEPMVHDLEGAEEIALKHPLVSAIAGVSEAWQQIEDDQVEPSGSRIMLNGDDLPPRGEFLVRDADSTQSMVINDAVEGASLVVVGPPGTGKSQTIANLLATFAARGRRTLFVAEKRAAIDAVVNRLNDVGLSDLVLDLHEGMRSRRQTAEQLNGALQAARGVPEPDVEKQHRILTRSRKTLNDAQLTLHQPREPWGESVYELQGKILALDDSDDLGVRLRGDTLDALAGDVVEQARDDLREYIDRGGAALDATDESPWSAAHRASTVKSQEQVNEVEILLNELSDALLPDLERELEELTERLKIEKPRTVEEARTLLSAFRHLQPFRARVRPTIFSATDLDQVVAALEPGDRSWLHRLAAHITNSKYRHAKRRAASLMDEPKYTVAFAREQLSGFSKVADNWRTRTGTDADESAWEVNAGGYEAALKRFAATLKSFSVFVAPEHINELEWTAHREWLERLQRDRLTLSQLPHLCELRQRLTERGLAEIARQAYGRGVDGDGAMRVLDDVWTRSVLDEVEMQDSKLISFRRTAHDTVAREFRETDRDHITQSPRRIKWIWAEAVAKARKIHPNQWQLVSHEANRKRGHLPTRELFQQAPDVLTTLKPCWVMSPLVVAQLLPLNSEPPFDVVVFDEASQIPPADAISSLLRGRQAIIAGDPKQLPPTSFFDSSKDDDGEEANQNALPTQDVDSILDTMSTLLPSRTLGWHYRSEDERIIAFSNHHIYRGRLTTFPSAVLSDCLSHVEVPFVEGVGPAGASYSPEVQRTVELILAHAAERPNETLGVIAFGTEHADKVTEQLRLARRDRPDLDEFFSETNIEPFFVKNLERVQGDERDAIILTVGYSRAADGKMRYHFGPINQEGGFRRLNVAVTRAKRRMTIVSCFSHGDMDPDRIKSLKHKENVQMLRDYIEYAANGGRTLGSKTVGTMPLNSFEADIERRLAAHGLDLHTRYGFSDYRIDFVAMHPEEPERPILAIEADGAQYHFVQATRDRDRLRQDHLERLGWRFHRIWSTEWFRNPEREVERCLAAWRGAVEAVEDGAEPPSAERAAESLAAAARQAPRRASRPSIGPPRATIADYGEEELVNLVRWIRSDGKLRTMKELIQDTIEELGYRKRGGGIEAAVRRAIAAANRAGAEHDRR